MNKLLVLILVVGMASVAKGALSLSVDGDTTLTEVDVAIGDTIVIGIHSDNTDDWIAYLDFYDTNGKNYYKLSNWRFVPGMTGLLSGIVGPYDGGYGNDEFEITVAAGPGETNTTGVQFEIDLTCVFDGMDVLVELYDGASPYSLLDTLRIYETPEPMTIALLGFGGLFLLHRRK